MSMKSITTWNFSSEEPFSLARRFSDLEGTCFLYSGGEHEAAQFSFLCLFPQKNIKLQAYTKCWEELQSHIGRFESPTPIPEWVGYLGYEMGCFADPDRKTPYFKPKIPDCCFYAPSVVIQFEHGRGRATLYSKDLNFSLQRSSPSFLNEKIHLCYVSDSFGSYQDKIAQAKEWILDGEIYQVNLSQELHFEGKSNPFDLFEKIVCLNPTPFAAYLNCGAFSIVSSSPERFLRKKGKILDTRPIKGTAPRSKLPTEDAKNREKLEASEKQRAELLMITDLMRSDLGKISMPGSVHTKEIWRCEAYENVFHLLSIIEATVRPGAHPIELIRQLFPGGSITGCPKLSAMEAIAALENRPRGIYTGSIGYIAANGDFDFNIAIRTLIVHPESIRLQLGGAIVSDSDPIEEFKETLYKGRSLFSILGIDSFDSLLEL